MVTYGNTGGGFSKWQNDKGIVAFKSVDNTAAPGVLIRSTTADKTVSVIRINVNNKSSNQAKITFYDENSNVKLVYLVDANKTTSLGIFPGLFYTNVDIYARTNQSSDAEITVFGYEF